MTTKDTELNQQEQAQSEQPAGSVPAFQFSFTAESFTPRGQNGQPHDPSASKVDPHHQRRIYHRRGSHKVLGKR